MLLCFVLQIYYKVQLNIHLRPIQRTQSTFPVYIVMMFERKVVKAKHIFLLSFVHGAIFTDVEGVLTHTYQCSFSIVRVVCCCTVFERK